MERSAHPEHYNRSRSEFSAGQRHHRRRPRARPAPKLIIFDEPVVRASTSPSNVAILNLLGDCKTEYG